MNGPFYYDDVEIIREELQKNLKNRTRFEEDRNKTINDYYRMNLDQTVEKSGMTGAYHGKTFLFRLICANHFLNLKKSIK